ncbi:MAG TPA: 4'-phosphopantetheinyl transferase superfamily protein, partial [Vicinamibacterales bacterium]|nr:4'-phosphopantetheinyl transferase superfamily protein [Vicinamibacterales bacterium]
MSESAAPTRADLRVVRTADAPSDSVERLSPQLTEAERARCLRFVREADRRTFAITRALVRRTLSEYGPTPPLAWRFVTNAHDCPFVAPEQAGMPPLHFNVSHTDGLVALAVTRGHRLGVDVERVTRVVTEGVAERHFAAAEIRDLRAQPIARQPVLFFDYWTLKEAYIKARGMGLALPLDAFAFALRPPRPPTITFAPGFDDAPERWQFWQACPTPEHRLSLAIERDT